MKLTTEQFIEKAKTKHGDIYDYSEVNYINSGTKVRINCKEHGMFEQIASGHLRGAGCSKCSGKYQPTTEEWIEKAKTVHGDKYDYSNANYTNKNTKVIILCKEHGEFEQIAHDHVRGSGCSKCGIMKSSDIRRHTNEQFIEKATEFHGYIYDYSNVIYINALKEIIIICKEHGEFEQKPNNHLMGQGCPKCANSYPPTTEEWIEKAKTVHGDKYDYSRVNYINANTSLIIICKEHGEFKQISNTHLHGHGCSKCSGIYSPTTEEWIEKAKTVHGDKYDYSYVNYINQDTKVIIICKEHGPFEQFPGSHLRGARCFKCYGTCSPTTEEWIEKAKTKHEDKYDYYNVNYTNNRLKVRIICKEHGPFEQSPHDHLSGRGCSKCSRRYSQGQLEWLEYMKITIPDIRHILNHTDGEFRIPNSQYHADGYSEQNRLILEYHGDFWHGNPDIFTNPDEINPMTKKTYGELYAGTIKKQLFCENEGYNYTYIWESKWIHGKKALIILQRKYKNR